MKSYWNGLIATTVASVAMLVLVPTRVAGQAPGGRGAGGRGAGKAKTPAGPTPRLPDGKPDLGNAAGSWNPTVVPNLAGSADGIAARTTRLVENPVDVPFQPWAKDEYQQRNATLSKDDPESRCLPPGIPRLLTTPFPFQIYQVPGRVLFIFEGGAHTWRVVYTDGRGHPKDPNPTYLGDSIGHWEGDTLVVDVIGFNSGTWLDQVGHPHSDVLHVVERYTRTDALTLHYEALIDDAKAYTKTWTTSFNIPFAPSWELMEYVCQENNRDLSHMVGK